MATSERMIQPSEVRNRVSLALESAIDTELALDSQYDPVSFSRVGHSKSNTTTAAYPNIPETSFHVDDETVKRLAGLLSGSK